MKVHVLIRQDLGMTRGKICAQGAHAVLGLYKELLERDPVAYTQWASLDFEQATYSAMSSEDLYKAQAAARRIGIPGAYVVCDAGRTQIAPMTPTVCALGPATEEQVRAVIF